MRYKDYSRKRKSVRNCYRLEIQEDKFVSTTAANNYNTGRRFEEEYCRNQQQQEQRSKPQHKNQRKQNFFAGGGYRAIRNTPRQSNDERPRPEIIEIPRTQIQKHCHNQSQNIKNQSFSNSHQSQYRSSNNNNNNNSSNFCRDKRRAHRSVQLEQIQCTLKSIATKQPYKQTNGNNFVRYNKNNNNKKQAVNFTQEPEQGGASRGVNRHFDSRNLNANSNSNYPRNLQPQNKSLPSNHQNQRFHENNSRFNSKYENQCVDNANNNFTSRVIQHHYDNHKQENIQSAFPPKNHNNNNNNSSLVRIKKSNCNHDWIPQNENDTWGSYEQDKNLKFPDGQLDSYPNISSNQISEQSNSQRSNDTNKRNMPAQNSKFSNFSQIPRQQFEDVKPGWVLQNQNDTFEFYNQQADMKKQKAGEEEQEQEGQGWAVKQKSRANSQYQNLVDGFSDMESLQGADQQRNFSLESRRTAEVLDRQFISQQQQIINQNLNSQKQQQQKPDTGNIIYNYNARQKDVSGSNNQRNDDFQVGGRSSNQDFENQSQVQQNESATFQNSNENLNQDTQVVQKQEFLEQESNDSCNQQQQLQTTCDQLVQKNQNSFLQTRDSENGQQPEQQKESSILHVKNEGDDYLQQNLSCPQQQSSQQNLQCQSQEQQLHPQNSDEQLQVRQEGQNGDDEQQQLQKYRQKQQSQYLRQKQNQIICDGSQQQQQQQLVQSMQEQNSLRQFSNVENENYLWQCDKIDQLFEERLDDDSRCWEPRNEENLEWVTQVRNEGDVGESRVCTRGRNLQVGNLVNEWGRNLQHQCCSKEFCTQQPLSHLEDQQSDEYSEQLQSERHMQLSEGCNWQEQEDCSENATSSAAWGYGSESFGSYKKEQCCVCGSDEKIVSVLTCGHQNMCWKCFLKLRLVYDKNECPVCREQILEVTLSAWPNYSFENRQKPVPSTCVPGLFLDVQSFKDSKLKFLMESFGSNKCPICVENDPENWQELPDYKCWKQLSDHFASHQSVERRFLCFTCCEATSKYCNASLERYTKKELEEHIHDSHGYCYICRRNFYCNDQLNEHISMNHYRCDICPRYFSDKYRLKRHVQGSHHICQECRTYNAAEWHFDSWVDLQRHLQLWHPGALSIAAEYENDGGLPQQDHYQPFQNEARLDEEESRQHLWRQVNVNVMDNVNLWLGNPNNNFTLHPHS